MILKINGSSSTGNQYILEGNSSTLLIEAGIPMKKVKIAVDFNISKIRGVLISHEHL